MDFSSTTSEEIEEEHYDPIPPHLLQKNIETEKEITQRSHRKKKPKRTVVEEINFIKPLKRMISDDYYDDNINSENQLEESYKWPPQLEKELHLLHQVIIDIENESKVSTETPNNNTDKKEKELKEIKENETVLEEYLQLKKKEKSSVSTKINDQLIDQIYGKEKPIGHEISQNDIQMNPTGLISLHSLSNEFDEIFNQFDMTKDEKEQIKDRFDTVLESLIFFIDQQKCDVVISEKVLNDYALKHNIPIEFIKSAYQSITQFKSYFQE